MTRAARAGDGGDPAADLYDDFQPANVVRGFFRCERPSQHAGWLLADGTFLPARCGATNKCAYCAYRRVLEDALVITLDAERFGHPRVGMTLTTVDPDHSMAAFRDDIKQVFKAIRRRLGDDVAYLGMMEWTTGRAQRSGGRRRAHQHVLLRNCLPGDAERIEPEVREIWQARTGASRVEVRELRSPAGATAYLIHHHRKRDQAPPKGWSGKRLRPSKNYYGQPIADLRAEARGLLRNKRLRKAANRLIDWQELDGAPDEILDEEWAAAMVEARHQAALVTFVKLDRFGAIKSYAPSSYPDDLQPRNGFAGRNAQPFSARCAKRAIAPRSTAA